MTRNQKIILGILSVAACSTWLVIFLTTSNMVQAWRRQPLGPTLAYPAELQLRATWTASPAAPAAALQTITPFIPPAPSETQTPLPPFLVCNYNLPAMTILAIGTDVRPGEHRPGLTDVMRAVPITVPASWPALSNRTLVSRSIITSSPT
jgi:hypothetical protein